MTVPGEHPPRPAPDPATLDRVFGEVLPETTRDERDPGDGRAGRDRRWYDENRPPHHGG